MTFPRRWWPEAVSLKQFAHGQVDYVGEVDDEAAREDLGLIGEDLAHPRQPVRLVTVAGWGWLFLAHEPIVGQPSPPSQYR
jgi:hypothetical protein